MIFQYHDSARELHSASGIPEHQTLQIQKTCRYTHERPVPHDAKAGIHELQWLQVWTIPSTGHNTQSCSW